MNHLDRNRTRIRRTATAILASFVLALIAVGLVAAPAGAASASTGWARFGHFAPSAEPVDVFVDGELFAERIGFKTVSDYGALSAGVHRFEVKPTGEPDATAVVALEANVPADGAVTIGAVTTLDGVATQVFDDELVVPEPDASLVRFIHAAPEAAAVDIAVKGGADLATDVPYPGATEYAAIEPGAYDVVIADAETGEVLIEVAGWTINAGEQSTIVVVQGTDGALDVAPVVDAVAVASAPSGGVQTGFGGMAGGEDGRSGAAATVAALAGLLAVTAWRRRSRVT